MDERKDPGPLEYLHEFTVPEDAIDANGHVNNVVYVQWMQDLAIKHWYHIGGADIDHAAGCTWVARSHHIEYLRPAFKGDRIIAKTWIATAGKVRSMRRYNFRRAGEDKLLAQGETDWVFIDVSSGRPKPIPAYVRDNFPAKES
ncbi:MAG: acyl-CoA thioesterase [Puniceicoccaceae bacterium]